MTSTSRLFRRLALGLALLQFTLQGAFAIADGQAAVAGESVRSHIESHSSPHCPKAHTDDCQLCQFLTNGTGPVATVTTAPPPAIAVHTAPVAREVDCHSSAVRFARRARGPPPASSALS